MRIEEGKFYRDANGAKQGPLHKYDNFDEYMWSVPELINVWWSKEGKAQPGMDCVDLVAEWTDEGPVRTVQRIVPGTYDGVIVKGFAAPEWVILEVGERLMTADSLERAAAVLTALAGALRDGS